MLNNLFKLRACLPDINKELTDFFREFIDILLACSHHFFLLIEYVKLDRGGLIRDFLKADGIYACFLKPYLHEGIIVMIIASLINNTGILVIDDHADLINLGVDMITKEQGILNLLHLILQACGAIL